MMNERLNLSSQMNNCPEAGKNNNENIEVSFVIPCLNEEKTLPVAIDFATKAIKELKTNCEIIISDNGSTDKSVDIAEKYGCRVVYAEDKGYGNALLYGIKEAKGKFIVMGDADGTYDFREIIPFIKKLREGNVELVMGSRLRGNIEKGAMPLLHRFLGTPVLTFLIRFFYKVNITDCNCGMRAFTKDAFNRMNLVSGGMEFASEMLIKAGLLKMKVEEIPCSLYKDTRNRPPHLNTWRDGWRHLKFILTFASRYIYSIPGYILILFGIISTFILTLGTVQVGEFVFDYHFMLLASLSLVTGYQLLWMRRFDKHFISFVGYFNQKRIDFPLERYLLFALLLFIIGLFIGIWLFLIWFQRGYINIFEKRLLIVAIDLFFISITTVLNSFMISMMDIKTRKF